MFDSITISEMFVNSLMVYTVQNPTIKTIKFDDNKLGDFSPMTVTVTFEIEGMSNDMLIDTREINDVIGTDFDSLGQVSAEYMSHFLQKRYGGNTIPGSVKETATRIGATWDNIKSIWIDRTKEQVEETYERLSKLKSDMYGGMKEIKSEREKEEQQREEYYWNNIEEYGVIRGTVMNVKDKIKNSKIVRTGKELVDFFRY
jgi:hypothetical protein